MEILNKKVIIRADRAGVFFGTLVHKENTPSGVECEINDCRRLWYWDGAASLSQMAMDGVKEPRKCKFSVVVPQIIVMGVIEIIPCTEDAIQSIERVAEWKR